MELYNVLIPIHETPEGQPSIDETIDKLDEMLTQYGVAHFFTLSDRRRNGRRPEGSQILPVLPI